MQSYGCITEHVEVSENIYFVEEFAVFRAGMILSACQLLRNSTTYLKKYFHNVHNAGGEAQ